MSLRIPILQGFGRWLVCLRKDARGQDLIEYALLASAVAVIVAAFLPPQLMPAVSTIFSKISVTLAGS